MKQFPVALQLYSVRDFMAEDFEGTVQKVASFGYDGVEFAGTFGKSAAEVRDICERAGVKPISAHVPMTEMIEDAEKVASYYAEIGVFQVVIPHMDTAYLPGREKHAEYLDVVAKMSEAAHRHGLVLCYHNHDFEFTNTCDGRYCLDVMYEESPAEVLQSQIDTCWAQVGMGDAPAYLGQFADRAPTVHLKDFVGEKNNNMYALIGKNATNDASESENTFQFRPVGYGKMNFPAVLETAEKIGAKWVIVEQDRAALGKTSLECAQMSIAYLKDLMK